jgi:DNA-binding GntR family transcriptional regulator
MSPAREYLRIADMLRGLIESEHLRPCSRLPSETELAAKFGVARNTIRRALADIERGGLLVVVPGKGRIVCAPGDPHERIAELLTAYRQIAADLRSRIEHGEYAPAEQLPGEMTLARNYGVSRVTIRRALTELQAAGLLTVAHGKGWFAAGDTTRASGTS